AMYMNGSLRPAGGAAGEMQERHVLWIGRGNLEIGRSRLGQRGPAMHCCVLDFLIAYQDDVAESAKPRPHAFHFSAIEARRSDQDTRHADDQRHGKLSARHVCDRGGVVEIWSSASRLKLQV